MENVKVSNLNDITNIGQSNKLMVLTNSTNNTVNNINFENFLKSAISQENNNNLIYNNGLYLGQNYTKNITTLVTERLHVYELETNSIYFVDLKDGGSVDNCIFELPAITDDDIENKITIYVKPVISNSAVFQFTSNGETISKTFSSFTSQVESIGVINLIGITSKWFVKDSGLFGLVG